MIFIFPMTNQPNRKTMKFLTTQFIYGVLLLMAGCGGPKKQPNVLFILIDDMGWKDLGCYGRVGDPVYQCLFGQPLMFPYPGEHYDRAGAGTPAFYHTLRPCSGSGAGPAGIPYNSTLP
jgi:hypothetical protein